jgi:hypothetical protein
MGQYFKVIEACTRMGVPWEWCRVIWLTRACRTLIAFALWVRFRSPIRNDFSGESSGRVGIGTAGGQLAAETGGLLAGFGLKGLRSVTTGFEGEEYRG